MPYKLAVRIFVLPEYRDEYQRRAKAAGVKRTNYLGFLMREVDAARDERCRFEEIANNVCAEAGRQGREHAKIIECLQEQVEYLTECRDVSADMTAWGHVCAAVRKRPVLGGIVAACVALSLLASVLTTVNTVWGML